MMPFKKAERWLSLWVFPFTGALVLDLPLLLLLAEDPLSFFLDFCPFFPFCWGDGTDVGVSDFDFEDLVDERLVDFLELLDEEWLELLFSFSGVLDACWDGESGSHRSGLVSTVFDTFIVVTGRTGFASTTSMAGVAEGFSTSAVFSSLDLRMTMFNQCPVEIDDTEALLVCACESEVCKLQTWHVLSIARKSRQGT